MTAVEIVRDQLGRLVGLIGNPSDTNKYMSQNAEEAAESIAADDGAFASWAIGEVDYPDAVNVALERIAARRPDAFEEDYGAARLGKDGDLL